MKKFNTLRYAATVYDNHLCALHCYLFHAMVLEHGLPLVLEISV